MFWVVIFGHFGGQKSRFLDFFKVVLELFRKCLGIVFGLKRPTFGGILSSKGWKMTQKIEIFGQNFAQFGGFEGSCLTILSPKTHFLDTFVFFRNFRLNYLDSLIPITCALLWGPAKPYRTGLRSKLVNWDFDAGRGCIQLIPQRWVP